MLDSDYLRILSPIEAERSLGAQIYPTFSSIFTSVLTAMCDHDLPYLEGVMEKRLFQSTKRDLDNLKSQKYQLNYLEPTKSTETEKNSEDLDEKPKIVIRKRLTWMKLIGKEKAKILQNLEYDHKEHDMKISLEPYGVLGAEIKRDLNVGESLILPGLTRGYYIKKPIWPWNFAALYQKQIIVINVYFMTKRKIYVSDEENFLVHGTEDTDKWLPHKWRFETFVDKIDWVLTDMDDYLMGNPYFYVKKNREWKI
jgi:hypothetical protein